MREKLTFLLLILVAVAMVVVYFYQCPEIKHTMLAVMILSALIGGVAKGCRK